jgi:hypothetical protein
MQPAFYDTTVTTVKNRATTIVAGNRGLQYLEADQLFSQFSDLVNDQFKPWYCKHFHRLGRQKTFELAALARADGFNKRRLFSYLLKVN